MSESHHYVFVNLKRFEVPKTFGGLCPLEDPVTWIRDIIRRTIEAGFSSRDGLRLVYLLPEGLIPAALDAQNESQSGAGGLQIGCQGVHWEDLEPGGSFGAFTSLLPAKAARALGASWTIIGHSEERRAKHQVIESYDSQSATDEEASQKARDAIDALIQRQIEHALRAGLDVLLCVGESAEQRGNGTPEKATRNLEYVLQRQIGHALADTSLVIEGRKIAIGYEPIWAIGPGRVPPDADYIDMAASISRRAGREVLGYEPPVVYGGGLKLENAGTLGKLQSVSGGLVALTRFTGDIGFDVEGLKAIVDAYTEAADSRG